MWNTQAIESVSERDIDLLLLEELTVNECFRRWFLGQALGLSAHDFAFIGAYHSIIDAAHGESDIVMGLRQTNDGCLAILIENKVDADFQPRQIERYRHRGQSGIDEGMWNSFLTCLIAPQDFLDTRAGALDFDCSCSYEILEAWFKSAGSDPDRLRYKARLLRVAIERCRRGYVPRTNESVTTFWHDYWHFASVRFPSLQMARPGPKPTDSHWAVFKPVELPLQTRLLHKWGYGRVDLELSGLAHREEEIRQRLGNDLPPTVTLEVTGKSLAIRNPVPVLDRFKPFDQQLPLALHALETAQRLLSLAPKLVVLLESLPASVSRE